MDTLLHILLVSGASGSLVFLAGWLLKTALLESLKRESDNLISQIKKQADTSLEQLKQQGAQELETTKQKLEIEKKFATDLRTEFMAEQAINRLLSVKGWEKRSFKAIQARIGGFTDNELKQLLVRSGAVRFRGKGENDAAELWGLLSRNELSNEQEEAI